MHSGYVFSSYLTDEAQTIGGDGLTYRGDVAVYARYSEARTNADHHIKPYEEVGNTAYITFEHFYMANTGPAYYREIPEPGDDPDDDWMDTVDLILYDRQALTDYINGLF